ncbi:MAG: hypothetical protein ACRCVP_05025 [Shewanella xiamenensis]
MFTDIPESGSPWHLLTDTQRVRPWMLDRPFHGADGRLRKSPWLSYLTLASSDV